ncbi:NAD-dependent epimerase/dehydratase family protein [Antrihabitans stalactiti]|uniref:NAD-dependent epimerase/dehydratase family protein n=1 Tax=Antrihabitans stalactiti TaxID=2584121 RepID=A0A848K7U4_9NOCA|nr:NAD-dependent epimerase/dehydratase family protein [Antrihabitans stalactiti]NMN95055.1 NAD-dependent epimerase/dehydratase family protein [Antrihabitans stalactiti]
MKVAVTGATSDFGTAILPVLLADLDIDSVVGLSRRTLQIEHPKLEAVQMDIRDPQIEDAMRGCAAVIHLAFVVEEIKDKTETHDINLRGSRNVIDSAHRAGVRRVVIASSINAYGPEVRPEPVTEDVYPEGDPDRYYFHDKAEVEHYAEWWLRRHAGEMAISMLRPTYIIGPSFSNDGIDQLTGPVAAFPRADEAAYQFLHESDMADAFHRAAKQDLDGPFNLGPKDWVGVRELAAMQGQRLFDVPERPAIVAANIAFRLGLTPFSGHWVTAGETIVDSARLTAATGWRPSMSAHECAAIMILLQGKPLLRKDDALERHIACEAALAPASAAVGVDGHGLEHVQLPTATGSVHAEVHVAQSVGGGAIVIPAPPGLHARYLTPIAAEICAMGIDVVVVDLPGHGLSTGKRGHANGQAVADALEVAAAYARSRFHGEPDTLTVGAGAERLSHRFERHLKPADGLLPRKVRCDSAILGRLPHARTPREAVAIAQTAIAT